ncbi:hypothetical protein QUB11_27155 [Microcoleus sp. B6-A1]|uniref:hypothetical protein n=1 Tax=Microcoleus sp. B6-A1 TaxID=2818684 RepID=UPI002FD01787
MPHLPTPQTGSNAKINQKVALAIAHKMGESNQDGTLTFGTFWAVFSFIKGTFGHSFTSLNRFCPVDLGFFYSIVLLHILYSF